MNTLQLVFKTLQEEAVYAWILGVIGSSITSLRKSKENDPKTPEEVDSLSALISIILGTVFSKYLSHPLSNRIDFLQEILPLVYIVLGLIGNIVITTIVTFVKKLGASLTSDKSIEAITDYLKSFITRKQDKNGLQ